MSAAPILDEDLSLRLSDGRRLGYAVYGAAGGWPVLYCHGGLSCRIDVRSAADAAVAAGVRLIAPDRPGIASSDRLPGRSMGDFAQDVTELADALGLERFAVLGWSLGGQYALMLAQALAPRVTRAAVVAGAIPLDRPGALDALNALDRRYITLARAHPARLRAETMWTGRLAQLAPAAFVRASARQLGPEDAALLQDGDTGRELARAYALAVRDGHGLVDEYLAFAAPWGFDLTEVQVPVRLWQGDADRLVPPTWADELAAGLPQATVTHVPGAGHLVARSRWPDILGWLSVADG
jgi:pimeloyl-ACP methyl ester carboxylesterase